MNASSSVAVILFLLLGGGTTADAEAPDAGKPCVPRDFGRGSVVCVCSAEYCDTLPSPQRRDPQTALLYTSSKEGLRFQQTTLHFQKEPPLDSRFVFTVTSNQRFQKIHGWGATVTDSAGINIAALSPKAKNELYRSYFSSDGIEYNILRIPIGGTDCSTRKYTLNDAVGDVSLNYFNLTREDYYYKIPVVQDARKISARHVRLMASAWTAPPWMKTNNDFTGFSMLKSEFYQVWADYHLKFLDAYEEEGLSFWALTTGNEPINGLAGPLIRFNSLGWTPTAQSSWIAENLGPSLRRSRHNKTLILALDDQRAILPLFIPILFANEDTAKYIDGIAVHWYTDYFAPALAIDIVRRSYPEKFIIGTEASSGFNNWDFEKVILGSWKRAEDYFIDILEDLNHGFTGWMEWSLVLDTEGGPSWSKNFVDTSILVNATTDEFLKQPTFYAIGHFSKFLPPGSRRILVEPETVAGVTQVGFIRPDGATVIIFLNPGVTPKEIVVSDVFRMNVKVKMPPKSFNTLIYW